MCSAPWYWNTRRDVRRPGRSAAGSRGRCATRTRPSTRCWTRPWSDAAVGDARDEQRQQEEDPDAGEQRDPEHQRDRALAELDALRPPPGRWRCGRASGCRRSSVSYRTTRPRMNGHFDQRVPWKPESRRSVAQTISAVRVAEGDGDRVATAHQDALDEGLAAVGVARHGGSLPAAPGEARTDGASAHGRPANRKRRAGRARRR